MARYEHLPIYKTAMELALLLQKVVAKFSRYNKYSIGTDLRAISRRVIQLTVRANSLGDRLFFQGTVGKGGASDANRAFHGTL